MRIVSRRNLLSISMIALALLLAVTFMPANAYASRIHLSKTKLTINVGQTKTLRVLGTKGKVKWSSSKNKIVRVSKKGRVVGNNPGKATIKATIAGKTLRCKVSVKAPIDYFEISTPQLDMVAGDSKILETDIYPSNTTESKKIKWSSSDNTVASVDDNGKVTAISDGATTIVARTGKNGRWKASCIVYVRDKVTSIKFEKDSYEIEGTDTLNPTWFFTPTIITNPSDISSEEIRLSSDNESVAQIVDNGKSIMGKSSGTATITATVDGISASCKVTVTPGFKLSDHNITMTEGETRTITLKNRYRGGGYRTLSHNKYVVVTTSLGKRNSDGISSVDLKATGAGTTTIDFYSDWDDYHDSITVTVMPPINIQVTLRNTLIRMIGDYYAITAVDSCDLITSRKNNNGTYTFGYRIKATVRDKNGLASEFVYKLYDSSGSLVDDGYVISMSANKGKKKKKDIYFYNLRPGQYRLDFVGIIGS